MEQQWVRSVTVSLPLVGTLVGSFLLPFSMNRFGRRFTGMLAVNVLSIFSSVLQVCKSSNVKKQPNLLF
jgi:hypothetical protein